MDDYREFERVNGPAIDCIPVPEAVIEHFQGSLPESLLRFWEEVDWCGYAEGLLWMVNPLDFGDLLSDWFGPPFDSSIAFLRTAFGDMVLWHDGMVYYLDVLYGRLSKLTDEIDLVFGHTLCADGFLDEVVNRPLFQVALSKLGPPASNECYAFVPALALGGPGTADSLQRMRIREHLSFLAQLVDSVEPI